MEFEEYCKRLAAEKQEMLGKMPDRWRKKFERLERLESAVRTERDAGNLKSPMINTILESIDRLFEWA